MIYDFKRDDFCNFSWTLNVLTFLILILIKGLHAKSCSLNQAVCQLWSAAAAHIKQLHTDIKEEKDT